MTEYYDAYDLDDDGSIREVIARNQRKPGELVKSIKAYIEGLPTEPMFDLRLEIIKRTEDPVRATVILFKESGKYYTEEQWIIPDADQVSAGGGNNGDTTTPYCMKYSPDFHRVSNGPVLVPTQEPWGYPHLI